MNFTITAYQDHSHNPDERYGRLTVHEEQQEGVTVLWADVLALSPLDSECAVRIGIDAGELTAITCVFRHSEFWCRPWFGTDVAQVPDETHCLMGKKPDGSYLVILPVTGAEYKSVLEGTETGLTAKLYAWETGMNCVNTPAFVCGEGSDPFQLLHACAKAGAAAAGGFCPLREERVYPPLFEYLGWCSWDAMEIRVNEKDLCRKAEEFREKHIPVRWAILDDMWADVPDFYDAPYENRPEMFALMHASRLHSFEADPRRFPGGLKGAIDKLKEYGLHVGMWHPTTGYWRGIDPDGPIFKEHRDTLIQTADGKWIPSPEKDKAFHFYDAFHTFLQSCGAEFVKVDNQSMTRRYYKYMGPVGKVARDFHTAIDASAGAHFGGALINCMGCAAEDQWSRPSSAVSRCSDDFLPEDKAWFTKHILQCSYNSMVQGQFYWCDWDMWWTDDGQATKNSLLRAISGGPIYVSDQLERSRGEHLLPLCLKDGRILRCLRPAMPTEDSIFGDPETSGRVFTLQNRCKGGGVLASFNLSSTDSTATGSISPSRIPGLEGETFALWERFTGEMRILNREDTWEFTLRDRDEFRFFVAVPYVDGCACIGLKEKFLAPAAVEAVIGRTAKASEPGTLLWVQDGVLVEERVK